MLALLIALSVAPLAGPSPPAVAAASPTRLVVDGAVPRRLALDAPGFAALPHTQVTATIHGAAMACSGVALIDLVAAAGVATGEAVRGPALATVVVARAADDYQVAFSLGEIERTLGRGQIIVADRCNGLPLANGEGPWRIVAAGDLRGARSVRALARLTLVAVP